MIKKHALLLFSKPPIPGFVKTRLTKNKGGLFTNEEAAEFFKRSLFDVAENCMHALAYLEQESDERLAEDSSADSHEYDFFISTTPESNKNLMEAYFNEIGPWPRKINYIADEGSNFDDHFDDAFKQIFDLGYESIVSVGGDLPLMPQTHVMQAFQWLEYFAETSEVGGFVQAPCQECGVSIVGYTNKTPMNHQGVYYNTEGRPALDAYIEKAAEKNIPVASLTPVADIDTVEDLAHAISMLKSISSSAETCQPDLYVSRRVLDWVEWKGIKVTTPPNSNHDPRQYVDAQS